MNRKIHKGAPTVTFYNELETFAQVKNKIDEWQSQSVDTEHVAAGEMMNTIIGAALEQRQWENYQHFLQSTDNLELRKLFAQIGIEEEEHLSMVSSLIDPDLTPIEGCLALEMTVVETLARAAQLEPAGGCRAVYDYLLLDHVEQTKMVADKATWLGVGPRTITKDAVPIIEGRPIEDQFVKTEDLLKEPLLGDRAEAVSLVNLHTVLGAEMNLRNLVQVLRQKFAGHDERHLCSLITAVETLHIAMVDSLVDPKTSALEYLMAGEMAEIRIDRLGMTEAQNAGAREVHEYLMKEDHEHLERLREAYARIEGGDVSKFTATDELFRQPPLSTTDYVTRLIETGKQARPKGIGFQRAA